MTSTTTTRNRRIAIVSAALAVASVGAAEAASANGSEDVPITVTVTAGDSGLLSLSYQAVEPDGFNLIDGQTALQGQTASGFLGQVIVDDTRADRSGWDLNATFSAIVSGADIIPLTALATEGSLWLDAIPPEITLGARVAGSASAIRPIATASDTVPAGTYDLDLQVELEVPEDQAPGEYHTFVTIDLIGG
ncbi:hypothetical protein BH09ACT3_BH09ACT3_02080 [soil metagenome]